MSPGISSEVLAALGLSPQAVHFLTRRGIATVAQLCANSPRQLLWTEGWLSSDERRDRRALAGKVLHEIRVQLARRGLALRSDRYVLWVGEPVEKLELSPRAASLVRGFRVRVVGDLLDLTTDDLFSRFFRPTAASDLLRGLARYGLHLADGRPYDPEDVAP